METKRTIGDVLKTVIADKEQEPGGRLYDLVYIITMMQMHQWLELNRRCWDELEGLFDIVIAREKKSCLKCGRSIPVPAFPENTDVEALINTGINLLLSEAKKRRCDAEELIQDLMQLPVEENLYSNLLLLKKCSFYSILLEDYFYYIHYKEEGCMLRRMPVSEFKEDWEPEQGEYIFPNVSRFFYNKARQCLSLQLWSVNTFIRYYPATGLKEVVYHKALKGIDDAGKEICVDQPREIIENEDATADDYWIHAKGRIGLFDIANGKVHAVTDYVSEEFLSTENYLIRMVNGDISSRLGEVYFDLKKNQYIVKWPYDGDLWYLEEVEEVFKLNDSNLMFLDKENNWREIKELETWPDEIENV